MANNIIYPVATLLEIEPHLIEYFAYNRTMLYTEIERMYLATWGFMGKVEDKYMIEVPSTLDELATSDNPFDWQRYAPREQKMIKVVDTLAYMTDNIKGILFEDDGLKKKISDAADEALDEKHKDEESKASSAPEQPAVKLPKKTEKEKQKSDSQLPRKRYTTTARVEVLRHR